MIIDLRMAGESLQTVECDLCIVGSGAAGLALASEMLNTHYKVVLIESGGLEDEVATQALYNAEISGLPHPGTTEGRFRVLGGSMTRWAGQGLPLMSIDFERRSWVAHSGWPITFATLQPYYLRSARFMLLDQMNFDTDLLAYLKAQAPSFNAEFIHYHFSKWSPRPNLRETYLPSIRAADHCTLLLHANLTRIDLNEAQNNVQQVLVRSLEGQQAVIRARRFILCTGGIETARLLLANNHQNVNGIGNDHDLVGRYFQDHPSAPIGWLESQNPKRVQEMFNLYHKQGLKYSVRCTAAEQWQRQNQMLNISASVVCVEKNDIFKDMKDIYRAMRYCKFHARLFRQLCRVTGNPWDVALSGYHYFLKGRNYVPGARLRIGVTSEQEPNPDSRVMLSTRKDALGMPLSNIQWQLTELTYHSIQQFAQLMQAEFQRLGFGKIALDPWLLEKDPRWMEHVTDQFHHIGTTRMHDLPTQGVVDRNCRVHGISNLLIGSSAVFPTSGHSNPTFTIIALCMRMADQLKQELR